MTLTELKTFRGRAPVIITSACLIPYIVLRMNWDDATSVHQLIIPVIALTVAFFYGGLDLRKWHWKYEISKYMGPQIREALLDLVPKDLGLSEEEYAVLGRNDVFKSLTGVFWEAIDQDEQLRSHKEHFYSNGATYTTAIDVYILTTVASAAYMIGYLFTNDLRLVIVAIVLVAIGLASRILVVPAARKQHLKLSSEQLDLLRRRQRSFVEQRFREIVTERRRDGVLGGNGTRVRR